MSAANVTVYPVYTGEFLVQVADTSEEDSQYGRQYKLTCEFVDIPKQSEQAGKTINIWASTTWSLQDPTKAKDIRSKIVKITEAAFGRKIEVGEWCEATYLQGRKFVVALYEKEEGKQGVGAFKPFGKQPPMPAGTISDEDPDDGDFETGEPAAAESWDDLPETPAEPISAEELAALTDVCKTFAMSPADLFKQVQNTCGVTITKRAQLSSAQYKQVSDAIKLAHAEDPFINE